MKIGVIGLGDICQKAYLPVLCNKDSLELVLCTRNTETLAMTSRKYRIKESADSIEGLIDRGIEAAFVHTATESHASIIRALLANNIHVYVDKPISYHFDDVTMIAEEAARRGKIVMVGFNRRFAPLYQRLFHLQTADIVLMQKNRVSLPGDPRTFVYDDFIHVVDSLRYLTGHKSLEFNLKCRYESGLLYNVVLELTGLNTVCIGIMNRDNGISEEIVEFMTPGHKFIIKDMARLYHMNNNKEVTEKASDWEPTLFKRGFYQVVDHFLECVEQGKQPTTPSLEDSLITHRLCERIVESILEIKTALID